MNSGTYLIPGIKHHRLQSIWSFSYCIPPGATPNKTEQWEQYLHHFSDFISFEDFYGIMNTVEKPSCLPIGCRYYVFRKGIKPIWEDKANENGYYYTVEYNISPAKGKGKGKGKSEVAEEKWMDLTLSVLTENIPHVDKINGVEFFHRTSGFRVALWTRKLEDQEKDGLEQTMKKILGSNSPPMHIIKCEKQTTRTSTPSSNQHNQMTPEKKQKYAVFHPKTN